MKKFIGALVGFIIYVIIFLPMINGYIVPITFWQKFAMAFVVYIPSVLLSMSAFSRISENLFESVKIFLSK